MVRGETCQKLSATRRGNCHRAAADQPGRYERGSCDFATITLDPWQHAIDPRTGLVQTREAFSMFVPDPMNEPHIAGAKPPARGAYPRPLT
jgi:hypothetical protein